MIHILIIDDKKCRVTDFDHSYFVNTKMGTGHTPVLVTKGMLFLYDTEPLRHPLAVNTEYRVEVSLFDFFGTQPYQMALLSAKQIVPGLTT